MAETFTVFIDPTFDAPTRESIGNAIVTYVFNRTKQGRGINNKPFSSRTGGTSYSEAYQEHTDFGIAGKSPSPINLTLTGDMLDSLEVLDTTLAGRIIIGIEDAQNAEKARFMREKGYNFMGISRNEQDIIMARFSKLTPQQLRASRISESVARRFLKGLVGG